MSQSAKQGLPGSLQPLAGERCESQKSWDHVRKVLVRIGADAGEWAGCPMIHDTIPLVIEPRYPFQKLNGMSLNKMELEPEQLARASELVDFSNGRVFEINSWYDPRKEATVFVYHTGDGRSKVALIPTGQTETRFKLWLRTLDASNSWPLDAEITAVAKLRELITDTAYRYYVLTGSFLETSKRSQISYMFRKCRPTLAMTSRPHGLMRIIAALCMHPIGYYERTWAGVMVPTDCVISHLLLMRADEHKFWSKANAHAPMAPEAGL